MPSLGLNKTWQRLLSIGSKKHGDDQPRGIDRIDSSFGDEAWNESGISVTEPGAEPQTYAIPDTSQLDGHVRLSRLRYKPLNEAKDDIRILNIISEPGDEHIRCILQHFSCSHKYPDYTALSYCWGTLVDAVSITVDGAPVSVTANLAAALRSLRANGHSHIWVDALCINQNDQIERGQQILRMKAIYRHAATTIAWLGPDSKNQADTAFTRLKILATRKPEADFEGAIAALFTGYTAWRNDAGWSSIKTLMEFAYWKRTWIIQELALSRSVLFWWGQSSLPLDTLDTAMANLRDRKPKDYFESGYKDILYLLIIVGKTRNKRGRESKGMNLERILTFSCRSLASEPRDKIFGVLGLSSDGSELIPNPDYRKPLDTILRELTISMLRRQDSKSKVGPSDLICIDNPTVPKRQELPSWTIDWTRIWKGPAGNFWASSVERGLQSGYLASGKSNANPRFSEDGITLTVRGYVLDRVCSLSAVYLIGGDKPKPFLSKGTPGSTVEHALAQNVYGGEGDLFNAIWRSLIADRIAHKKSELSTAQAPSSYGSHFAHLWSEDSKRPKGERLRLTYDCLAAVKSFEIYGRTLEDWSRFTTSSSDLVERSVDYDEISVQDFGASRSSTRFEPNAMEFIYACKFRDMFHRRLLTTRKGYVGLAHAQSQIGDTICVLEGCTIPMILRPCDRGFRLVGDAYVHGIMNGEYWQAQPLSSIQEFDLK
ncbi:heterokaryon incompatibility protein-domain-containing protein [Leptodontidium sp. 2 PMI_412]|nr:heterokaryon incompatibility protein-domain-containing protein [Leptodontidium sp. MPI-SDFR-AT-0119]KAH9210337.1 heterokaryon incompatibility protein-domain-containing protein [Leptodontidium sp. 2 PMI_412]